MKSLEIPSKGIELTVSFLSVRDRFWRKTLCLLRPLFQIVLSAKEAKQIKDDKERLTDHFMQTLPPLLEKYGLDSDKLTNLLSIPQYFNLERYTSSRQEGVSSGAS